MSNQDSNKEKSKKFKFKLPHLLFLMLGLMMFMSILTYIVPAGQFGVDEQTGAILGNEFTFLEANTPVSPWDAILLILDGVQGSAFVIALLLLTGGAVGIVMDTGAIDEIINWAIYMLKDKGIKVLLPIVFMMIGILGGFGGGDQMIALVPIGIVLAKKLKLDPIVAVASMFFSSFIGFGTGPTRLMVPQSMMDVPVYSGFGVRFIVMMVMLGIGCIYTVRYALKVNKDPNASYMGDNSWMKGLDDVGEVEEVKFNPRAAIVVAMFFLQYILIVVCMVIWKKPYSYMPAIQILTAIASGLIYGMSFDEIGNSFAKGAAGMAFVGVVIGLAKSMSLIMENGKILHTIVYYATLPLKNMSKGIASVGMSAVITVINLFIPSASGKAAILIPIIKPITEALNIHPQIAVSAFQFGDGFTNLLTPALGVTIGSCQIAGVPFNKWVKWAFPAVIIMTIVSWVILYMLTVSGWTGL